jgi:hypothetical protein
LIWFPIIFGAKPSFFSLQKIGIFRFCSNPKKDGNQNLSPQIFFPVNNVFKNV